MVILFILLNFMFSGAFYFESHLWKTITFLLANIYIFYLFYLPYCADDLHEIAEQKLKQRASLTCSWFWLKTCLYLTYHIDFKDILYQNNNIPFFLSLLVWY